MSDEVHVGDVGTIFEVTILDGTLPLDISDASEKKIFLRRPNDTVLAEDADFTTDGKDGKIEYASKSGDIDMPGNWRIQAKVIISEGTFYSDITTFIVEASLST